MFVRACLIAPAVVLAFWMGACGIDAQLTNGDGGRDASSGDGSAGDVVGGDDGGAVCGQLDGACFHGCCTTPFVCTAVGMCETTCSTAAGSCKSDNDCCRHLFCGDAGQCNNCLDMGAVCSYGGQCCNGGCGSHDGGVPTCSGDSISR
jgi:hypothetical protein